MTNANALRGKTILIVEDDFFQADDARAALEAAGGKVVGPFPDSMHSVAALEDDRPDCALLDINLGASNSLEVARIATKFGVPFVFMTGYDAKNIAPEFQHVERLQKPVTGKDLVAAVVRACRP